MARMTFEDIRIERRGEIQIVTIDRPQARNALTFRTYAELESAVRDTSARCLVITGAGSAFCSGDDVKQVMGGGDGKAAERLANEPRITPAAEALLATDVPVIAAVNGPAGRWGMGLAPIAGIPGPAGEGRVGGRFVRPRVWRRAP